MAAETMFAGVQLPAFIPSVSSVKDDQQFDAYVSLLSALGASEALTSAYDWSHLNDSMKATALTHYFDLITAGARMVLDSGWYEAYWHRDHSWAHETYVRTALELTPAFVMSFDQPEDAISSDKQAIAALRNWDRDQSALGGILVVPVVHGGPSSLPAAVQDVAVKSATQMVAVAERDLGSGIVARAKVVNEIRCSLTEAGVDCGLHLLGTGNPISVLIYVLAGANSFDGLEWNRTATDFETARLHHSQQYDFFENQSAAAGSGSYWGRLLSHNLIFWRGWMQRIRNGEGRQMISTYVPSTGVSALAAALPGVFS